MMDASGTWFKCEYRLMELPAKKQSIRTVKVIAPVKGSKIVMYSTLEHGKKVEGKNGLGKKYQPRVQAGEEWPPHLALARLDLSNENDICDFCTNYGLLGLRDIPHWKIKEPEISESQSENKTINPMNKYNTGSSISRIIEEDENVYSHWYDMPDINDDDISEFYKQCEPLVIFKEAATEYQELIQWLMGIDEADKVENTQSAIYSLDLGLLDLDGCNPMPIYSKGKWKMSWSIRSLLEACYLRVIIDLTEGAYGFRICQRNNCEKIFLAQYETDRYCCERCRKANTSYNSPPRVLKRYVKEIRDNNEISNKQKKELYRFIEETWKNNRPLIGWTKNRFPFEKFKKMVDDYINELTSTYT